MNTFSSVTSLTLALAFLVAPGAARADEAAAAERAFAAPTPDKTTEKETPSSFKPLALTLNPLSLIIGRVGVNVEYMVAKHHGIAVNPYYQSISATSGDSKTSFTNFGAELGYHIYTGSKGANGFFIGPSLIAMSSSFTNTEGAPAKETKDSLFTYGAAIDIGGQHVFDNGITLGAGAGLMYVQSNLDGRTVQSSSTMKVAGALPRVLLTVGYSF